MASWILTGKTGSVGTCNQGGRGGRQPHLPDPWLLCLLSQLCRRGAVCRQSAITPRVRDFWAPLRSCSLASSVPPAPPPLPPHGTFKVVPGPVAGPGGPSLRGGGRQGLRGGAGAPTCPHHSRTLLRPPSLGLPALWRAVGHGPHVPQATGPRPRRPAPPRPTAEPRAGPGDSGCEDPRGPRGSGPGTYAGLPTHVGRRRGPGRGSPRLTQSWCPSALGGAQRGGHLRRLVSAVSSGAGSGGASVPLPARRHPQPSRAGRRRRGNASRMPLVHLHLIQHNELPGL